MHHTYTADATDWRINDPASLVADFSIPATPVTAARAFIVPDDIDQWHALMSKLPEAQWRIVRRRYAVFTTAFKSYTVEETRACADAPTLAAMLGVPAPDVNAALLAARSRWHSEMRPKSNEAQLTDEEALTLFGMNRPGILADAGQCAYLARRIRALLPALQTPDAQSQARAMLETERQMIYIVEPNIADIEALLARVRGILSERQLSANDAPTIPLTKKEREDRDRDLIDMAKVVSSLAKQLDEMMGRHGAMQTVILRTSEALGLAEMQSVGGQERILYTRTISDLVLACFDYHAKGDRTLLDMMHAEDEITILTTPYLDRPAQYRVDLALQMRTLRDEFFTAGPIAVPTNRVTKRLKKGFEKGLAAALEEEQFEPSALDENHSVADDGIANETPAIPAGAAAGLAYVAPIARTSDDEEVA